MTHTPPSEAAASSPSPYLSEGMLRAQANPDCAFPDAVQVLSREVLRLRAQCPPTEEVEKLREGARSANALRLQLSKVEEERDAWRHKADTLGADLNRLRSLVPTACDEQTTFDAVFNRLQNLRAENEKQSYALRENAELHLHLSNIGSALAEAGQPHRHKGDELERIRDLAGERDGHRDEVKRLRAENDRYVRCIDAIQEPALPAEAQTAIAAMRDIGPELAKAGVPVGPRCSHAEAVAQLHGERDRWREKFEQAHQLVDAAARFEAQAVTNLAAHGFFAAGGLNGVLHAIGKALGELNRLRKESKRDQAGKQQALLDEIARLFPGKGALLDRVRAVAAMRPSFTNPGQPFDPSDPIGPKFAPATSQPRTEVPLDADGSGTVVELGEAFRRNMANAVDCLPDSDRLDGGTIKIAIRNLHAAVGELARVVGGPRS